MERLAIESLQSAQMIRDRMRPHTRSTVVFVSSAHDDDDDEQQRPSGGGRKVGLDFMMIASLLDTIHPSFYPIHHAHAESRSVACSNLFNLPA